MDCPAQPDLQPTLVGSPDVAPVKEEPHSSADSKHESGENERQQRSWKNVWRIRNAHLVFCPVKIVWEVVPQDRNSLTNNYQHAPSQVRFLSHFSNRAMPTLQAEQSH